MAIDTQVEFVADARSEPKRYGMVVDLRGARVPYGIAALNPESLCRVVSGTFHHDISVNAALVIRCGCGSRYEYATLVDIPEIDVVCACGQKLITYGPPPAVAVYW